jgi:hypothetical protein
MKEVVMATPISLVRPIPANPNLEFDRNQAKALLDAARRGESDASRRFNASHPRFAAMRDPVLLGQAVALHDAQLVIAREYGFASWPRWKQFVETRRLDRAQRAAELIKAACSNDVRKARLLTQVEPDLASFDIYTACVCGEADAVKQYLSRDSTLADRKGGPLGIEPILSACFSRFLRADPARAEGIVLAVRALLERAADPNAHAWIESGGQRWLQSTLYGAAGIANNAKLTTLLLDAGARLDAQEDNESLYHATEFPDPSCLRLLLERGSPPADQVFYCLGRATDFEYPAHVALYLKAGANPNFRIKWDGLRTQLHKAVYLSRSAEIVGLLIDGGGDVNAADEQGISILRSALLNGNAEVVNLLRSRGARDENVTETDVRQGSPITLCIAAGRNDVATINRLLDAGADPNRPAAPDQTPPLHWAAWRGRFNAVQRLVERGADIHWVSSYGGNALGAAIYGSANCFDTEGGPGMRLHEEAIAGDYTQIVEYLIACGSKPPDRVYGGSDAVQEILRSHGIPDAE